MDSSLLTSFSKVEYLTIFASFIYGYVATQSFLGWGTMISHRKEIKFSYEHLLWTIMTFLLVIDIWWGSWLKGFHISSSRPYFYLSLLSPLIFYVLSTVQFPALENYRGFDFRDYFNTTRKYNYSIFILLLVSFYLNDVFLQDNPPASDFILTSVAIVIATAGLLTNQKPVHVAIVLMGCVTLTLHTLTLRTFDPAQYNIANFSVTEYLTIFTAIIYGAVASKFFGGWGSLVFHRAKVRISQLYIWWSIFIFILLMDIWYGQWDREQYIARNIGYFLLSLTTPTLCFFSAIILFPRIRAEGETDLALHFSLNRKILYLLLGLVLATNFLIANIMSEHIVFGSTNVLRIMSVIMAGVGIYFNRPRVDWIILTLAYIMIAFHAMFPEATSNQ
jgi:hypothetical protein